MANAPPDAAAAPPEGSAARNGLPDLIRTDKGTQHLTTVNPESFWKRAEVGDDGSCWPWRPSPSRRYGSVYIGGGRGAQVYAYAHRVAWVLTCGPIPEGAVIHHRCRNTRCVNPRHLMLGTQDENVMRDTSPPAVNARKTVCVHGHAFTPENTRIDARGYRNCRRCERERNQRRAAS